ncbi:hypothetical protein [Aliarcobacter butzleri]|uniref:hypothetical protein n=1 Tax=Aliarcobacter butzleri TaxID=28197 RepID=UPI0021B382BC|nr:hypothetical protein [Aliarcobacter butzleri]MCT7572295.1 hypothetical protein [Aliarcobacter butzleri]
MYNENDKKLFFEVFGSKGKNSWTLNLKKRYIYTLKKLFSLNANDLAENIVSEDVSIIFEKIVQYDDSLNIFKKYLKQYETYARKSIGIYNFGFSEKELKKINTLEDIPYDYSIPNNWQPIELKKSSNEIIITLAKGCFHATNLKFSDSNLKEEIWTELKSKLLELTDSKYSTLKTIKTELMEETRVISRIKFDLEKNVLELGTDFSYIQENGKRTTNEQQEYDKKNILEEIYKLIPLEEKTKTKIENSFIYQEDSLLNDSTFNNLLNLNEDNMIIIPTTHHFYNENDTIEEHNEDIITNQRNQKLVDIEKKIKEYYTKEGSLNGFLIEYPEHNTSLALITEKLKSEKTAKTTNFHAFAILVRDISEFEKNLNSGKMDNKTIDSIIFDFNINDKKLNIKNNNYSEEIYETIISKILEFSK